MQGRDFMAVQSITGADAMPQGSLESSRVYNEQASRIEEQKIVENPKNVLQEENKGIMIDTRA